MLALFVVVLSNQAGGSSPKLRQVTLSGEEATAVEIAMTDFFRVRAQYAGPILNLKECSVAVYHDGAAIIVVFVNSTSRGVGGGTRYDISASDGRILKRRVLR